MLEHQEFLVRPPMPEDRLDGETCSVPACAIVEPTAGRPLGFARWHFPAPRSWLSWLSRPVLMVHEAEDEPLVFTIQPLLGLTARWEVCDSDGHRIAIVRRKWVLDRFGDCLAWIQQMREGERFRGREGQELASTRRSGAECLLRFTAELRDEPFVKMAILGAALTRLIRRAARD
jgi:hypothetical protein